MTETETTSLLNKKVNDLTLADTIKINVVILAVMAAIPVTLMGVSVARERIELFKGRRADRKIVKENSLTAK